jgi:dihydroorotate dehydrogenase
MSVAGSKNNRIFEAEVFVDRLIAHADSFKAPFGLQVNLSCPNTGHDTAKIAEEAKELLEVFQFLREIDIPIVPKFNVLFPVEAVVGLQDLCDAVCISNTIPWGKLPGDVDWINLFPGKKGEEVDLMLFNAITDEFAYNPLKRRGIQGGGLSGKPLLPLVYKWVKQARTAGIDLPINAGGGILGPKDVDVLAEAGADSVFLGSIAILRGWRLSRTIKRAWRLLGGCS